MGKRLGSYIANVVHFNNILLCRGFTCCYIIIALYNHEDSLSCNRLLKINSTNVASTDKRRTHTQSYDSHQQYIALPRGPP